jgi:hypothetical protein
VTDAVVSINVVVVDNGTEEIVVGSESLVSTDGDDESGTWVVLDTAAGGSGGGGGSVDVSGDKMAKGEDTSAT